MGSLILTGGDTASPLFRRETLGASQLSHWPLFLGHSDPWIGTWHWASTLYRTELARLTEHALPPTPTTKSSFYRHHYLSPKSSQLKTLPTPAYYRPHVSRCFDNSWAPAGFSTCPKRRGMIWEMVKTESSRLFSLCGNYFLFVCFIGKFPRDLFTMRN